MKDCILYDIKNSLCVLSEHFRKCNVLNELTDPKSQRLRPQGSFSEVK